MEKMILQVSVLRGETKNELEKVLNDRLKELQENDHKIIDIKFMGYNQDNGATRAIIIFEDYIYIKES